MREIIGNTTATPNPRPDWAQPDPTKADYIKNKPKVLTEDEIINLIGERGGGDQVQADWTQTDNTKPDYIKNKITNNSQLINDSGFITRMVADLENYYTKSETYTQSEINERIGAIPKFSIEVASVLPTENISSTTVYLVTSGEESPNLYDEYIYVNNSWEKLGTQKIDLSSYATLDDLTATASNIETSVYKGIGTEGWYRIAEYHSSSLTGAQGASGCGCTITIRRSYNYKSSEVHSLQLVAGFDQSFIQSLHDYAPVAQLITAARHTVDTNTNTAYFEIYYNPDGSNLEGLRVTVSDGRTASTYDPGWKAIEPTQTDSEFSSGIYMIGKVYKIPSKAQILTSGSEIADGTDLNTITIPGYYKCSANVSAQTLTNCPTQLAFFMRVGEHAGIYQEIIEYVTDNPAHFYRNYYSGEWGNWELIITSENIGNITASRAELANRISVKDTRDETLLPNSETLPIDSVCAFFTNQDMPTNHWTSGLSVKGWGHDYTTWQLASNSDSYGDDLNLYMRSGRNDTWNEWRKIPFADEVVSNTELADIKNLAIKGAASYTYTEPIEGSKFFKISINDYAHWMMGFTVRTYQGYVSRDIRVSGYNYASEHWYEPKAILVSASAGNDTTVHFGYDSDFHLWVAIPAQNYAGISIQDVVVGYSGYTKVDENLFTITLVDSLDELGTIQSTQQVYRPATINEVVTKSGGTFDGTITTAPAKWRINNESGLDLNNSDIVNVNTVFFGDAADSPDEGIAFPRYDVSSSKQYDIFRMHEGKAYVDTITLSYPPVSSNLRELLDDKNYTDFVYTKAEVDQKIANAITSAINASY